MYIKNNGKHLPTTLGRDFFAPTYYQSKRLSMHYFHSYCLENTKKKSEGCLRTWDVIGKLVFLSSSLISWTILVLFFSRSTKAKVHT